jgi:hypothetical protein
LVGHADEHLLNTATTTILQKAQAGRAIAEIARVVKVTRPTMYVVLNRAS